ncbi:hypothetical protein [Micromonospora peucetia]|uniref:Uncharacterized protein n=1 Tax=Micromonospora peucetia TaxID=47871 RepID=A0ABZ1EAG9_9ACTN|nr:hypothetical protein [Micromonospora peucetia]WSA30581.1 hypothetical protein OIE14_20650 [Micromonospora peucetia]
MPRSKQQTHQAGRHLAAGQALLNARSASLVGRRTHIEVDGHLAAVIVASKGAWMIKNVDNFTASSIVAYVLVNVTAPTPKFFVAPGDELRRDVHERHRQFMARVRTPAAQQQEPPHQDRAAGRISMGRQLVTVRPPVTQPEPACRMLPNRPMLMATSTGTMLWC